MPNPNAMDNLYMYICERLALMSKARRLKVGAVVVKGENIISMGWNGMPKGYDNDCEIENPDGTLTTRPEVQHAEFNSVRKLRETNTDGQLNGATLYCTVSPCPHCTDLIRDAKVARVVYRHPYRLLEGVDQLRQFGIQVDQI